MVWLKAALFTVLVPGTVAVAVPWWILGRSGGASFESGMVAWLGLAVIVAAAMVLLRCVIDFATRGRGTPAPIDPPRRLVIAGLYRWTRNPMYVAVLAMLLGESAAFSSFRLFLYSIAVFAAFELFVILYEEPALRRTFGDEYDEYCRRVPRWIAPRAGRRW